MKSKYRINTHFECKHDPNDFNKDLKDALKEIQNAGNEIQEIKYEIKQEGDYYKPSYTALVIYKEFL